MNLVQKAEMVNKTTSLIPRHSYSLDREYYDKKHYDMYSMLLRYSFKLGCQNVYFLATWAEIPNNFFKS